MNFEFEANIQNNLSNGYVVHKLELHIPEEQNVGYVKVEYIPSDVWEEKYCGYEGILRWIDEFKGYSGVTSDDLVRQVVNLSGRCESWHDRLGREEAEDMSESELKSLRDMYVEYLWSENKTRWKNDREHHVDKPRIAYIEVKRDYRRNGYGTALYRKMLKILQTEYGLKMYSSTLQQPAAEKAWEKLITLDWNESREIETPHRANDNTRYELSMKKETKAVA